MNSFKYWVYDEALRKGFPGKVTKIAISDPSAVRNKQELKKLFYDAKQWFRYRRGSKGVVGITDFRRCRRLWKAKIFNDNDMREFALRCANVRSFAIASLRDHLFSEKETRKFVQDRAEDFFEECWTCTKENGKDAYTLLCRYSYLKKVREKVRIRLFKNLEISVSRSLFTNLSHNQDMFWWKRYEKFITKEELALFEVMLQ